MTVQRLKKLPLPAKVSGARSVPPPLTFLSNAGGGDARIEPCHQVDGRQKHGSGGKQRLFLKSSREPGVEPSSALGVRSSDEPSLRTSKHAVPHIQMKGARSTKTGAAVARSKPPLQRLHGARSKPPQQRLLGEWEPGPLETGSRDGARSKPPQHRLHLSVAPSWRYAHLWENFDR